MKLRLTIVASLLICPAGLWGQYASAEQAVAVDDAVEPPPASPKMEALFAELVADAQHIGQLLNEVTDKESADRVAQELDQRLTHMNTQLHELEQMPLRGRDAEALKQHMATLTHVCQSTLQAMQRLAEVNAYGSEALMGVFSRYKIGDGKLPTHLQDDDLPHTQLYAELTDAMEDALYCLQRVQDEPGARQAAADLTPTLHKIERICQMLVQLAPPRTDEQREAVRPARERLHTLMSDLKAQCDRLRKAHCYNCEALDLLLPRLLQVAVS